MGLIKRIGSLFGFVESDDESEDMEPDEMDDEEDGEEDEEDDEESGSFFGRLFRTRRSGQSTDSYEPEPDEEPQVKTPPVKPPVHVRDGNIIKDSRLTNVEIEPHCERIVRVRQIDECRDIIQYLLNGESVLLNLENVDPKDCGRVVDLLSGAAFALSGRMVKVAHLSYLLAPSNVNVIEMNGYGMNQARYNR